MINEIRYAPLSVKLFFEKLSLYHLWNWLKEWITSIGFIGGLYEIFGWMKFRALEDLISKYFVVIVIILLVATLVKNSPRLSHSRKLKQRDANIEIRVEDLLAINVDVLIPTNDQFDFTHGGQSISTTSVQGQFIHRFCQSNPAQLDQLIEHSNSGYLEKKQNQTVFPIGTIFKAVIKNRYYMLASSKLNGAGNAQSETCDLGYCLSFLWDKLVEEGHVAKLAIPLINTGYAARYTREEAVKTIIRSYIASLSQGSHCGRLIIAIHPNDVKEYGMDLKGLYHFLDCITESTEFNQNNTPPVGNQA